MPNAGPELDPEDSSAKEVIEECGVEEISKRENSSNVKESDTVEPCATSNTHIETRETENIELRDKNMDNRQKEGSSGCNDNLALALAGVGT